MIIKKIEDTEFLEILNKLNNYFDIPDDYNVFAKRGETLSISFKDKDIYITYPLKASLLRALSLCSIAVLKNDFKDIEETLCFDECGVMLDLSRNGVMTVEAVKKYALSMALMGLNQLYLYMEDTYEIKGHPYFGYMRGRYTKSELKEIDEYCNSIGVEVIPHIQTLGHMEQYLKWEEGAKYRDTVKILLAEDETTYEFIENMISSVSSCFKTKKIHLGMDEAGNLGSGKYYSYHGPCDRKDILIKHIKRVIEISEKYGLTPIIYGDILYAVASGGQYAKEGVELSEELKNISSDYIPVYWNYYSDDYDVYKNKIKAYKEITDKVYFWGGIWTWQGLTYDAVNTMKLSKPALMACKDAGVRTAIGSVWGDDGNECDGFFSLHGAMYYAEHMYNRKVNENLLKERFEYITKGNYDAFIDMSYFLNDFDNKNDYPDYHTRYFGKRYFWSDILLGFLDKDLEEKPMSAYYEKVKERYKNYLDKNSPWYFKYQFVYELFSTISKKCYIAENLKKAYDNKDRAFLEKCVKELLPELKECYKKTSQIHFKEWLKTYKPFGFEMLDLKYGALIQRIDSAIIRIEEYLSGNIEKIEELEAERLLQRCAGIQRRFLGNISACNYLA